jgi:hypothetical protein
LKTSAQRAPQRGRKLLPKADVVLYWTSTSAPWGLAILLLAVSMPHLASGFQSITHCGPLAAWLLALAIDSAQVVAKLQMTMTKRYVIGTPAKYTSGGIVAGTALMSMALNVLAFLSGATDRTGMVLAWVAGVMLPLLILALSYTGSAFMLAKAVKQPTIKKRK